MKITAIIAIMLTGIGCLVLAFGGDYWSAPFAILAIILFIAAGREQKRREAQFIQPADRFQTWQEQYEERRRAETNRPTADPVPPEHNSKPCVANRASGKFESPFTLVTPPERGRFPNGFDLIEDPAADKLREQIKRTL